MSDPFLDALSRVNAIVRTGEGSLWDSSLLMHRRRSFGRRDCSIRRARQSACSRQHSGLITSSLHACMAHLLLAFRLVEVVLLNTGFHPSAEVFTWKTGMSHSGWHMLVDGMADRI